MQALFVDNLTVIDFAYFHPERGIVGESLIMDVELQGELNDEGMLFDFSYVKKRIKSCVDCLIDHKLLVAKHSPQIKVTESPQQLVLDLTCNNGHQYQHISPTQAVYFVDAEQVSPVAIAESILNSIKEILPENVTELTVNLRPEKIEAPYYHYSHGLKKHFGDCQRIAHGHRSQICVWQDDQPSLKWAEYIAEIWQDIYLATEEDIKESITIEGVDCWRFEYHANQGLFQLTIPKSRCYLMQSDTTVELIASYLASHLKQQEPSSSFKVKAFEGVDKGAIMSA
jgi:6-pyruvoyl-tetrahydropterin synthase